MQNVVSFAYQVIFYLKKIYKQFSSENQSNLVRNVSHFACLMYQIRHICLEKRLTVSAAGGRWKRLANGICPKNTAYCNPFSNFEVLTNFIDQYIYDTRCSKNSCTMYRSLYVRIVLVLKCFLKNEFKNHTSQVFLYFPWNFIQNLDEIIY